MPSSIFSGTDTSISLALGVSKDRIDTIIDFAAAAKHGVKTDGSAAAGDAETLQFVTDLIAWGDIVAPLAAIYPFDALRMHTQNSRSARRTARSC